MTDGTMAFQVSPADMEPDMRKLYEMFSAGAAYIAEVATSRARIDALQQRVDDLSTDCDRLMKSLDDAHETIVTLTTQGNDARWRVGELEHETECLRIQNATFLDRQRSDEDTISDLRGSLSHAEQARDSNETEWQRTQAELDTAADKLAKITATFKQIGLHVEPDPERLLEPRYTEGAADYGEHRSEHNYPS